MSRLLIKAERAAESTVISDSFFTSPLKIAKPFYYSDHTEVMMMSASAGILDGDSYDIQIDVMEHASLKFTGQSYTKIFKAKEKGAVQNVKITVGNNASFLYYPSPVIPFKGSIFRNNTEIFLSAESRFAMLDVVSCGRKAMSEQFLFDLYRSKTKIYIDNRLVFLDNMRLVPNEINLLHTGFFEGYTHTGMLYIYNDDIKHIPDTNKIQAGYSDAFKGICVRMLGNSSEDIIDFSEKILGGKNYGLFFGTGG